MYCISINYRHAKLALRQKTAFDLETRRSIVKLLKSNFDIRQCVLLCTCNRTEVYFCGEKGAENAVVDVLARFSEISGELLIKHLRTYFDDSAIRHLFKVTSGIDSMVLGEDEILSQTKRAYLEAVENNTTGYELNMIFQAAFACAKKIKTDTALSKTSMSVATLASNQAVKFGKNILVIGAGGKVGSTVLKNLVSHKNVSVTATFRQHHSPLRIIEDLGVDVVDYNERYEYFDQADCIISATSSPHYTVTYYDLKRHLSTDKERLLIDLAVPRDIDQAIRQLNGARLMDIDYFEKLASANNQIKLDSVSEAKRIINFEIDVLKKDLTYHEFMPLLNIVKSENHSVSLDRLVFKMKSRLSAAAFREFIAALSSF